MAPPRAGILRPSVAALFGKTKNAFPKSRSSKKPNGASTPIVRQKAARGNCRSGRDANHHASPAIGTMKSDKLKLYPKRATCRKVTVAGITSSAAIAKTTWKDRRDSTESTPHD